MDAVPPGDRGCPHPLAAVGVAADASGNGLPSRGGLIVRRVLMVSPHFPPDSAASHRVRLLAPRRKKRLEADGVVDRGAYEGALDPALAALVPGLSRRRALPAVGAEWTRAVGVDPAFALDALRRTCATLLGRERYDVLFVTVYPVTRSLGPLLKRRFPVRFLLDYQDPCRNWGLTVGGGANGTRFQEPRVAQLGKFQPIAVRAADVTAVSPRTYDVSRAFR